MNNGDGHVISLQNVEKSLGGRPVLRGLSIDVDKGESLVIVGGSGQGKSVTLKHIIGLMQPDSGHVYVMGKDVCCMKTRELNEFRRNFGMAFQEGALFDSMNVFENIAFPLRMRRVAKAEIAAAVARALDIVQLPGVETKRVSELSGGQRRRVGFARAISLKPEILLFDEPTTGLDPVISDVIADLIVEMDRTLNSTTVSITHDMKVAFKIADRVAMLHHGQIIEQGTPDQFQHSPNPMVQQFIEGRAEGPLTA